MFRCLAPLLLVLAPGLAAAADTIRVYNWNDYIAPQVLADFTKATGIEVDYHTYSSAEELDKALKSGENIDIAVPSHNDLPRLIREGALQPLDFARLPNRSHLDKQLLSKLAAVDPQNRHAVPYLWGAVGLAINTPKAEAAMGAPLSDSWSLLFDPAQSAKLAGCGISVLDAPDELISVLMNYQGNSYAHSSPGRIRRAGKVLDALRPNLRYVDSERYIEDLNKGDLCVAVAWVGDALAAAQAGQPVRFVVPQEGSVLFIDNLVIPSSARRADLAHRFIDFLMQPKVAAQITTETLYPNGNADAREFLAPELREQPGLYPDRDTKRRLAALDTLPDKLTSTRDAVWEEFRDGKPAGQQLVKNAP
ncbi:polyamine ABC transporter substrate-binding protein [Aquipseudomonas ullengensis]|uniref:Putrescine-binding periplasmic protein n=1 Tax=Aquipseudomonas ullengensis TaxID=2759166 RepID=A0A7W4LPT8_9GAMM|nr:polyamine ABC transporter substrate-binding protein [Pseudomonas ullengensis]MBB2496970.1 polyamine ABC transporter substrate-binding protein [Pseudomonas ullengensis]